MTSYSEVATLSISLVINLMLLGSSIVIGVAVSFRLTRPASPRVRYIIAVIAFFTAALLPIIATFHAAHEQKSLTKAISSSNSESINIISDLRPNTVYVQPLPSTVESFRTTSPELTSPLNAFVRLVTNSPLAVSFLGLWIIVAVLLLGREAVGHVQLARARRTWHPADKALREELAWPNNTRLYTDEHGSPCAVGLLRPAVIIPARLFTELAPGELRCITRHELSHVRWHDPLANALLRIVRAALWPSLPLWYLERVARLEREAAADRAAVAPSIDTGISEATVIDYATALVSIAKQSGCKARSRHARVLATEVGSMTGLEHRVRRLLAVQPAICHVRLLSASAVLLVTIVGMCFLPLASSAKATSLSVSDYVEKASAQAPTIQGNSVLRTVEQPARHDVRRDTTAGSMSNVENNRQHERLAQRPGQIRNTAASTVSQARQADERANDNIIAPQEARTIQNPRIPSEIERQMRELERQMHDMAEPMLHEAESRVRSEFEPQLRGLERQMLEAASEQIRRDIWRKSRGLEKHMQEVVERELREIERRVRQARQPQINALENQMREAVDSETRRTVRN